MNVGNAASWLVKHEPEGLVVRAKAETVFYNGVDIEIERNGVADKVITVGEFLTWYSGQRFTRIKWTLADYYRRNMIYQGGRVEPNNRRWTLRNYYSQLHVGQGL